MTTNNEVNEAEIIELPKTQEQLLQEINQNLLEIKQQLSERQTEVKVKDLHMETGSLVNLMFKWLIASIPVGFALGVIYFILLFIYEVFLWDVF